ncbi:MAG: cupin domain-containing protein [Sphingobium sp.]
MTDGTNDRGAFPDFVRALPVYEGRFAANRLAAEGCDVLFATYPAGTAIEEHHHDTRNWGVITKGALYLTVEGEERRYGPGDWYTVAANLPHSARFEEETAEIEFWFLPDRMAS